MKHHQPAPCPLLSALCPLLFVRMVHKSDGRPHLSTQGRGQMGRDGWAGEVRMDGWVKRGRRAARRARWPAALLVVLLATVARPARADAKAEAVLARCRAATAKLKSLKASLWLTAGSNTLIGTVTLKKPNKAWIQVQ